MEEYEIYRNKKGKTDSMYIYVLYNCSWNSIKEHTKKQLDIIDRVNDSYKRRMFSSRYYTLNNYVDTFAEGYIFNNVILIDDDIHIHELKKDSMILLQKYNHPNITFTYSDTYDLTYIHDLLFNDAPYYAFRVNNNRIEYIILTKTKKCIIASRETKPLDILDFVNENLPQKSRYILYGVSSKLKDYKDPRIYAVVPKVIKDEELINLIDTMNQEDLLDSLYDDLEMLEDIKTMHRVIFKKEIFPNIRLAKLSKLYIDSKMVNKFLENLSKNNLEKNFELCEINNGIKSFSENREMVLSKYEGVVGITYY